MKTTEKFLLWRTWTLNCAAGELLGIGTAGLFAVLYLITLGEPDTASERVSFLVLMLGAGAVEGTLLGWFQWRVLRQIFPTMTSQRWVRLTVAVAMGGWLIGMLPSTLMTGPASQDNATDPARHPLLFFALTTGAGLLLGAAFGWIQWLELRRHTSNARRWITANAIGWAVALSWIYLGASLPDTQTPVWQVVVAGIIGGALGGLSLGVITGFFLKEMTPRFVKNRQKASNA